MNWLFGKITDITNEQYAAVYLALTPSRKAHIDKMKKENDRKRSLMATYLLNKLLLQAGKTQTRIETTENGKPFLSEEGLYISISHSDEAVVCVLSETPVGIDVEKIKPVSQKLIEYVCTQREREYVFSGKDVVDDEATQRFFAVWTAKEAFYKKGNGDVSGIRSIDTFSFEKQAFLNEGYYITLV